MFSVLKITGQIYDKYGEFNVIGIVKGKPIRYIVVAVGSSRILFGKQKLGVTFNSDKQEVIDFTKISKMTMCRASEANSEK